MLDFSREADARRQEECLKLEMKARNTNEGYDWYVWAEYFAACAVRYLLYPEDEFAQRNLRISLRALEMNVSSWKEELPYSPPPTVAPVKDTPLLLRWLRKFFGKG